jgi:hypothetical protein
VIRVLRAAHRYLTTALAVAVPPALIVVLAQRTPAADVHPPATEPGAFSAVVETAADGSRAVQLRGPSAALPETLAYWSRSEAASMGRDAMLLGALHGSATVLALPPGSRGGEILVYSPPLQRVLAHLPIEGAAP